MRNRNCFSAIGTTLTSVAATAVALRGAVSMSAISPKMPYADTVSSRRLPRPDLDRSALNDEQFARGIALFEDDFAGLEVARRRARPRQNPEIDRCIRHVGHPAAS
jgi:hypothetical protein